MRFKNLEAFRTGGRGGLMELNVPLPRTPKARVYRFSPNEAALPRHFLIGGRIAEIDASEAARARMTLEPGSNQTVCPYSGVVGPDDVFHHPEDMKAAVEVVKDAALRDAEAAFSDMFKGLGRRSRGMLTVNARPPRNRPKPRFGRRDLMRELVCDHCGRDYGVFAIGLFCPDCGAPNLRLHFRREGELVGSQVDLAEAVDESSEELAYRLLGNAHEDVLTAFEATLKTVYLHGRTKLGPDVPAAKPVGNDFQNLDRGAKRFAELGLDPFGTLDDVEREILALNIQKRHIIGHNLGVVDARFASHAQSARIGETVQLVGEDIRVFAALGQKVVDQLDAWLAGVPSPTIGDPPVIPVRAAEAAAPADPLSQLNLKLSHLARKLGFWIAETSPDGLGDHLEEDEILAAFDGTELRDLQDAMAELEADGFGSCTRFSGHKLPMFRPTNEIFAVFDTLAIGSDPTADAVEIVDRLLSDGEDAVNVANLHGAVGWAVRRFNPALKIVLAHVDQGRVSQSWAGDYPTRFFHLLAEDRVAIRRFRHRVAPG